jgi:copper chaperone
MLEKTFIIEGMNCQHCVKAVEVELSEIGVEPIEIEIGSAKVKFDETKFSDKDIINAVDEAGFKIVS